jgi:ABC-2 type transport system ATP-binding protein
MIKTESLTKTYNGVRAVDSLSLEVKSGEAFGFLGPNGAGKTTAIGMMVGLIEPNAGRCFVDNVDVTRNPLQAKRITGYLPDGVGFYTNLSAKQNLQYFARFYDMSDASAKKRISELLDYVGLGGVEKPVEGYSRGMRQRLGLAQALLNDPKVIFMDEPTNGLDPQGVLLFRKIIKYLVKDGKTVFFSSHIMQEVQQVCSTIGVISGGKLIARGTIDEVRKKLAGQDRFTIMVSVIGHVPPLSNSSIIDASYHNGSAVIHSVADIRDDISTQLFNQGIPIRELKLVEKPLEEVFLEAVYGGV